MTSDPAWVNIRVSRTIHDTLLELGKKSDSFNDIVARLVENVSKP